MLVLDSLKEINDVIKDIAIFVQENSYVRTDFDEYLKTIGVKHGDTAQFHSSIFNYIFERNLGDDYKSIIELYLEYSKKLSAENKKIAKALMKSVSSIFEIKRQTKTGFELYNIINEKNYSATSLVKMTSFRGIGSGQYVVARIFEFDGDHYLLEISGVLPIRRKSEALRYAVAKIIQNPELVYQDNPEKLKELEKDVKSLYKKFVDYFGADEVITTNKYADEIIGLFNDFAETGERAEFEDKIHLPKTYRFFNVSEFNNSYDNFLENSLGGFSAHNEIYDVGIIFDKELGLYAIPFYKTFEKIFTVKDYSTVEGFSHCLRYFLANDKYPANIITRVASKRKNFMTVVNKILGTRMTLEELLRKYKGRYLDNKIFSSTTVLYKSLAFSNTLGIIEETEERPEIDATNVGRNDPCPCGSGLKYKKCCAVE